MLVTALVVKISGQIPRDLVPRSGRISRGELKFSSMVNLSRKLPVGIRHAFFHCRCSISPKRDPAQESHLPPHIFTMPSMLLNHILNLSLLKLDLHCLSPNLIVLIADKVPPVLLLLCGDMSSTVFLLVSLLDHVLEFADAGKELGVFTHHARCRRLVLLGKLERVVGYSLCGG